MSCKHDFANVGFCIEKLVCIHCDMGKKEFDEYLKQKQNKDQLCQDTTVLPSDNMVLKRIPLSRGFSEISRIFHLSKKYDAVIAGGYARYCASPNSYIDKKSDVDIFPSDNEGGKKIVSSLCENGFLVMQESKFSYTLVPPVVDIKNIKIEHIGWNSLPVKYVQVVKSDQLGKDGWKGIGQWKGREELAKEVLSTFDMTISRAAIIGPETALVDSSFWEDEKRKRINILGFKNLSFLYSRLAKYASRGYSIDIGSTYSLYLNNAENHSIEKKQEVKRMLVKIRNNPGNYVGSSYDSGE